ncbi:Homeobox-leucine zipper protein HOX32 [Platanthera zijinensis]|uniref:Homeobox-leucine zipper protein HOX32 n=1 Tax=Platanthera zijinensis TaxID=2320716 RepID=A0AAP0B6H4_9ASPA
MRSLTASIGGPSGPTVLNFVRAEMLSSGYLIRLCEGGGSMIHIVDHLDLDVSRGFNDTINGFPDDGWSLMGSDGVKDVTITLNLSSNKLIGPH